MKLTIEKDKEGKITVTSEGFSPIEVLGLAAYLELTAKNQLINEMHEEQKIREEAKKEEKP